MMKSKSGGIQGGYILMGFIIIAGCLPRLN